MQDECQAVTFSLERAVYEDGSDFLIRAWLVIKERVAADSGMEMLYEYLESEGVRGCYRIIRHSNLGDIVSEYDATRRPGPWEIDRRDREPVQG